MFYNFTDKIARRFSPPLIRWLTPERLRIYPPHIPVLILIFWSVSHYLGPGLTDLGGKVIGTDFIAFYTAGNFFLSDRMDDLYNFRAQYLFQRKVIAPVSYEYLHLFIYPPYTAPLFSFFARGEYQNCLFLWYTFGLTIFFVSVCLLRWEMKGLATHKASKLFFISFLFFPSMAWIIYGQTTFISFAIYALFFVLLRKKKDLSAGAILGLLVFKPQLAFGPGIVLLFGRRWRALAGVLLTSGLTVAIAFLYFPETMQNYIRIIPYLHETLRLKPNTEILVKILGLGPETQIPSWGIHSFFGFSILLMDSLWPSGANILCVLLMIYGTVLTGKIWLASGWEPGTRTWDMNMAASFGLGILLSPQLFTYDLMLLLLPMAILWGYYTGGTSDRPLDGNLLLFWSALVYLFAFLSAYMALIQLRLLGYAGLPEIAFQFSTPVILAWTHAIILKSKQSGR